MCVHLQPPSPVHVATFLIGQRPSKDRGYGLETLNCRGYREASLRSVEVCSGKIGLALKKIELTSYLTTKSGGFSKGNGNNCS